MSTPRQWDVAKLRLLHELIARLNSGACLQDTLQAVVDGVVDVAGFEVAVVNHVQSEGVLKCIAVAGNDAARAQMLGVRQPLSDFEAEFAAAERWGTLCFVPHDRKPANVTSEGWIPDFHPGEEPDAWHPDDALFAPLQSPGGELIGVLSVDLPQDRRRPGWFQQETLQLLAAQAGIAIHRAQLMDKVSESEQAFRLAFENAGIPMAVLSLSSDKGSRYLRVNQAFCDLVGYTQQELQTVTTLDITHPDDRGTDLANMRTALTTGQRVFEVEKRYQHSGGGSVWVAVTTSIIEDAAGNAASAISQVQDISQRRALIEQLVRDAGQDGLTGLANRRALYQRLHATASEVDGMAQSYVLFCDLDGFKAVNDHGGHGFGDRVLMTVAQRLRDAVDPTDMVARLGGDEFVVVARTSDVDLLADQLGSAVRSASVVDGFAVNLTMSVGIAIIGEHSDPTAAIHTADRAMYEVKKSGGNGYRLVTMQEV